MKKIVVLVLVGILSAAALVGCGKSREEQILDKANEIINEGAKELEHLFD